MATRKTLSKMAIAASSQDDLASASAEIPALEQKYIPLVFYSVLLLSGFSALTYEISWQLLLSAVLGSESFATTTVITSFLGGLALGYFLFGRLANTLSPRALVIGAAILEIFIAGWAFLFEPFSQLLQQLTLTQTEEVRSLLFGLFLIIPPTLCMGGTLPLITQAFAAQAERWTLIHARLYAANTFGGFLGIMLVVFFLLPVLGGERVLQVACVGNICAGLALFFISNHFTGIREREEKEGGIVEKVLFVPLLASFLLGFSSISLQFIFVRVFALSVGSAFYLFALVLGVYILWLALGGAISIDRAGERRGSPALLAFISAFGFLFAGFLIQYAPYWNHLLRIEFPLDEAYLTQYIGSLFLGLSVLLAIPLLCVGAFEPSLVQSLSEGRDEEDAGRLVGLCYGWNTVGSILGAVLTGFVLLLYFDLPFLYQISCSVLFVASGTLFFFSRQYFLGLIALIATPLLFFLPIFSTAEMGVGLFRLQEKLPFTQEGSQKFFEYATEQGKVLYSNDGASVTSLVMEFTKSTPPSKTIFLGGKADGNTDGDRVNMNVIGTLGSVLSSPNASRIGIIGFGTGMTIGAAARFEKYDDIIVFELDENAPEYAPYFSEATQNVTEDPRFQWRLGDAIRMLELEEEQFDVFISQPSNPWVTGMERLYSKEFYQGVRSSLTDSGVFVTWFTGRALGSEAVSSILFTFRSFFPSVRIFQFGGDYIMTATMGGEILDSLKEAFSDPKRRKFFSDLGFPSVEVLLAHEMWFVPPQIKQAKLQSLYQPYLSILGGGDFFSEKELNLFSHFHKNSKWYFQLLGSKRTLLASYLQERSPEEISQSLPLLIKRGCGGLKVSLKEPAWRTERTLCRDAAIAGMVYGLLPAPESLKEEVAWAKSFSEGASVGSDVNPLVELSRFALFDSVFLKLRPELLISRLGGCFLNSTKAALQCQVQLVRTLSLTGHSEKAKALLGTVSDQADKEELREYVELNEKLLKLQ